MDGDTVKVGTMKFRKSCIKIMPKYYCCLYYVVNIVVGNQSYFYCCSQCIITNADDDSKEEFNEIQQLNLEALEKLKSM